MTAQEEFSEVLGPWAEALPADVRARDGASYPNLGRLGERRPEVTLGQTHKQGNHHEEEPTSALRLEVKI